MTALPPIMQMPTSPLLPTAVVPLLLGLAAASRPGGHQPLAERLSSLIVHKLCGSKAEAAGRSPSACCVADVLLTLLRGPSCSFYMRLFTLPVNDGTPCLMQLTA